MLRPTMMASAVALALAACSSDNNALLDSGSPKDVAPDLAEPDASPDAAPDAPPDAAPDVTPDAARDVALDLAPDAPLDARVDAAPDVAPEAAADVAADAPSDVARDGSTDAPGCGALAMCEGRCVDTATDARHCGGCGRDCGVLTGTDGAMARCVASQCVFVCAPGRGDCDRVGSNGCEVDLSTAANCGRCGVACSDPTPLCGAAAGGERACTNGCAAGTPMRCGLTCVDPQRDVMHCGACGNACPQAANATASCAAGRCASTCNAGYHRCGDACVSDASVMSCGASCSPCAARPNATASCEAGACRYACAAGFADCDGNAANGCERPVSSDLANCGACGRACPGVDTECQRRTCMAGACGVAFTAAGTAVMSQTPRDCQQRVCDGAGNITSRADDADRPDDSNACTADQCVSGAPRSTPLPAGTGCGAMGMQCDGRGVCVECVRGSDCASGVCASGRCQTPTCTDGVRNGTEAGVDCGGSCPVCPALLVLATGTGNALAGSFDVGSGAWSTTMLPGARSLEGAALAVTAAGEGVGLVRYTELSSAMDNRLRYTHWRAGAWSAVGDLGPTVTTQGLPAVVAAPGGGAWAVFHGFDFNHYFAAFTGGATGAWNPAAEATGASGARAGAVSYSGSTALLVGARGLANELVSRTRTGTTWGGEVVIDRPPGFDANVSPVAVPLMPALTIAVWSAQGGQLRYATRGVTAWSAPANVPSALSTSRASLARLSATQAALAFRGTDGNLYAAVFDAGTWSTPTRVATAITGVPAVARGLGSARIELAWLDAAGRVNHARQTAGAWSAPTVVGGSSLVAVALASGP